MAEHKGSTLAPSYPERKLTGEPNGSQRPTQNGVERHAAPVTGGDGKENGSWDSYRRWLNRVQLPDKRRVAMDPALYTWKGYRNWAEKVRRDWTPEEK
jgi:hypothetical protein